jgi:hypothetical protein
LLLNVQLKNIEISRDLTLFKMFLSQRSLPFNYQAPETIQKITKISMYNNNNNNNEN